MFLSLKFRTAAVEPLIRSLERDSWTARMESAIMLGRAGDVRACRPLVKLLKDKEGHVRKESAIALEKIGDISACRPLITLLNDQKDYVRQAAYEALRMLTQMDHGMEPKPWLDYLKEKETKRDD